MAKKEITGTLKLQIPAGKANPAPPVGTALGPKGINIGEFCKQYNDATKDRIGDIIPVIITIYKDRSFSFVTTEPPVSRLILKALKLERGSQAAGRDICGKIKREQLVEIAKIKQAEIGALTLEAATKVVMGTAVSMGVEIEE